MGQKNEVSLLALILGFIGLVADLISISVFAYSIISGTDTSSDSSIPVTIARIIVLLVVFVASAGLVVAGGSGLSGDIYKAVFFFFGSLYILVSAVFLGRISWYFLIDNNYDVGQWFGYVILILIVVAFGWALYYLSGQRTYAVVVPYLLVTAEQIGIWLWQFTWGDLPSVIWVYIGNIMLFVVTSVLVMAITIISSES
jgi:hypothetical protein